MKKPNELRKYLYTAFYLPARSIYKFFLMHIGIHDKQILFSSFPDYSDNARVLYQYMVTNPEYADYRFVWLVGKPDKAFPKSDRTEFIVSSSSSHFGISLRALRAIATSKYLLYTHSSPIMHIDEKKGQTVINLWHGCGYEARKTPLPQKKQFDYALVPGPVFIDTKSKFWGWRKDRVIPIGYPRYDQMKSVSETTKDYYRRLKGECERVILWMPTFRKTERNEFAVSKIEGYFELPPANSVEQMRELNDYCRETKTLLCVKRHPKQIPYQCEKISFSNIKFIDNRLLDDNNVDLYGLLACVDGLVSDYSSTSIDYLLMDRPMAFVLNDMEDYERVQGFVFEDPLKYMPGHHLYVLADFMQFIEDVCSGRDPYKNARDAIMSETHNPCENYCERVCRFMLK